MNPVVDVYTIAKDEEILMPYFLRHYSSFAYRIFVIFDKDAGRTTRDIVDSCPRAFALDYGSRFGLDEFEFSKTFFNHYRTISRGVADWVICVDTDEFVYHKDIVGVLQKAKERGHRILKCRGFMMISEKLPSGHGQIYEEIKDGVRETVYDKSAVFDPTEDVVYGQGRHSIMDKKGTEKISAGLKLLHYRYLSREFIIERTTANFQSIGNSSQQNKELMLGKHSVKSMTASVLNRALKSYERGLKEKVRVVE